MNVAVQILLGIILSRVTDAASQLNMFLQACSHWNIHLQYTPVHAVVQSCLAARVAYLVLCAVYEGLQDTRLQMSLCAVCPAGGCG
jgi:hypothetical protein